MSLYITQNKKRENTNECRELRRSTNISAYADTYISVQTEIILVKPRSVNMIKCDGVDLVQKKLCENCMWFTSYVLQFLTTYLGKKITLVISAS